LPGSADPENGVRRGPTWRPMDYGNRLRTASTLHLRSPVAEWQMAVNCIKWTWPSTLDSLSAPTCLKILTRTHWLWTAFPQSVET